MKSVNRETAIRIVSDIVLRHLQIHHAFDANLYKLAGYERGQNSHNLVWRAHEALRVLGWQEVGGLERTTDNN